MKLLDGIRVLAWRDAADSSLARFLEDLGAGIARCDAPLRAADLSAADFLIENLGLERIAETGLSREQIEAANPRLIQVSVSTFGSRGPRSHWRGGELVASAAGGALRVTGEPGRPPVKEAGDACTFHADMAAAAGAMAAHYARGTHGQGQHVDVSIQQVAFSRNTNGVLVWQFDKRKLHRVGGKLAYGQATIRAIWRLADGWCFHSLMTGRLGAPANRALAEWMDEHMADNPLLPFDDAVSNTAATKWWLFLLGGLEVLRQAHYLVAERNASYYAFWTQKIFGRFNTRSFRFVLVSLFITR